MVPRPGPLPGPWESSLLTREGKGDPCIDTSWFFGGDVSLVLQCGRMGGQWPWFLCVLSGSGLLTMITWGRMD